MITRLLFGIVALLAGISLLVWSGLYAIDSPDKVFVHVLDVGQGDAILIRSGLTELIIDGGPSGDALLSELEKTLPFYDRTIEGILITHPDYDHFNGFRSLFDHYAIENVFMTAVYKETQSYTSFLQDILQEDIPVYEVSLGSEIALSDSARFRILYPFSSLMGYSKEAINETSVVGVLDTGEIEMLFMGDAERSVERELHAAHLLEDIEILKVGHHGTKNATHHEFLKKISPEIAILSVGENNRYGHPAPELLSRLVPISTFRTDISGTITIEMNSADFAIQCKKGC